MPEFCPLIFAPVCGCDGVTYSNDCFASLADVGVDHDGACEGEGTFCGGIAGFPCAGAGECVDDPSDDCDPAQGGADCGGICECNVLALCVEGFHFDGSPEVCACVADVNPCAAVLCLVGNECIVNDDGEAECVPIAPFCGGIAGIPCPGAGQCVDDPNDDCDPTQGGADCGGLCECDGALVLCAEETHFDPDPAVCACVADSNACDLVGCPDGTECILDDGEPVCEPVQDGGCND